MNRSNTKQQVVKRRSDGVGLCIAVCIGLSFVLAIASAGQTSKPNFSGTWTLDKSKSEFGSAPPPEGQVEVIDHHEPTIIIMTTMKQGGNEFKRSVRLTTDDAENTNMLNGQQVKTKTHWEGNNLVTVIKDPRGFQVKEVRVLSQDGKTQSVDTDFGMGKQKTVMVKK